MSCTGLAGLAWRQWPGLDTHLHVGRQARPTPNPAVLLMLCPLLQSHYDCRGHHDGARCILHVFLILCSQVPASEVITNGVLVVSGEGELGAVLGWGAVRNPWRGPSGPLASEGHPIPPQKGDVLGRHLQRGHPSPPRRGDMLGRHLQRVRTRSCQALGGQPRTPASYSHTARYSLGPLAAETTGAATVMAPQLLPLSHQHPLPLSLGRGARYDLGLL